MEENKSRRFRNHISIVAEQIGGGILAIAAVLLVNVLQDADELTGEDLSAVADSGFLIMAVILLILAAGIANRIFVWAKTYICIEENAVVIERGTMNKKKNTIGIRNISNINLEQNLFEMLLGTCKVKMDTNSRSTADSTDVKIVLKKADAEWFRKEIMRKMRAAEQGAAAQRTAVQGAAVQSGMDGTEKERVEHAAAGYGTGAESGPAVVQEEGAYDFRAEFGDIFQHGLFSINVFSLLILILGIAGTVVTVARILGRPDLMTSVLSAAAGITAAGAIVLSALWDTVKDFIRYYDFRAKRRGEKIYIRYGFFKKVEYTIPVDKIQALKVRQSLVARFFGRYMAEIVNVGMGDDKDEQNSFLVLYSTKEQLRERLTLLLPEFAETVDQKTEQVPGAAWAAWLGPLAVCCAAAAACGGVCVEIWPEYTAFIWIGASAVFLLVLLGMFLKYRTDGVGADKNFLKLCHGCFGRNYISVRYRNIQYAELRQSFIARACGIQKGEIRLLASSANAVHDIPYFKGDAAEKIRRGMLGRS